MVVESRSRSRGGRRRWGTVARVSTLPSYAEIAALPSYSERPVPVAFEDINGHMNVRYYLGIASEGLDEALTEVGIPTNWADKGFAIFSAEHHLTYVAELLTGDTVSVRVLLVGRSERALHLVVYLLDDTHEQISCIVEEICLHMDMSTRTTSPWPEEVASQIDARVAEHQALSVEPTLSGSMSLR
ncbi:acyl-CoA thioester hydrolase [Nocardioides aurantiacus]|uniref:Acyl-CoA thioester hydrolase n=1 Tax=Nocardioides aurantiacus TaxID=86796 RepID=A0A3N2CR08_9ACTN|nr:acyl-CoA thioester hydrolase [Nocardioides aurantiacus]